MTAFLRLNFLPALNELLVHCQVSNSSRDALTNSLKAIASASHNISCKVDPPSDYTHCTLDGSFDETLCGLIDNLPGALCKHAYEYVRIPEQVDRSQHFVDTLDELFNIEVIELGSQLT